jgi:hypothetical protein
MIGIIVIEAVTVMGLRISRISKRIPVGTIGINGAETPSNI